jgi:hypothetical protein
VGNSFRLLRWGQSAVNVTILLQKLIDIEKSIGLETDAMILDKIFDAENCLLQMQREMIDGPESDPVRRAS